MFSSSKSQQARRRRAVDSGEQTNLLTKPVEDSFDKEASFGDKTGEARKRTFVLGQSPNGGRSTSSKLEETEEPAIDVYDDIYDDIDDIDDFDAFEMDNGLRSEEQPLNELPDMAALEEHVDQLASPPKTPENKPSPEKIGEAKTARSFNDDDDIKPVPLKRTTVAPTPPDHQETDRSHSQELRFDRAPVKKAPRVKPDRPIEHQTLASPEYVFAETAKLLDATTPPQKTPVQPASQPDEQPHPRKLGFAPEKAPRQAKTNTAKANGKSADNANGLMPASAPLPVPPSPTSTPSNKRAETAPPPLPPVADAPNAPRSMPFPDRFSTLLIAEVPRLRRFAAAMIGDEDDADLLVEATLRQAAANANGLPSDSDLIVVLLTMLYRRRHQALRRFDPLLVPTLTKEFDQVLFQRLTGADRDEIREFAMAISSLSEEDRAILLLLALENLTYPEVATIIGIPVDKMITKIVHARERLSDALKDGATEAMGSFDSPGQGDIP